jgi:hypothetical protein
MKIQLFWDMTPCWLVNSCWCFIEAYCFHFRFQWFRNVGNKWQISTTSYPRRYESFEGRSTDRDAKKCIVKVQMCVRFKVCICCITGAKGKWPLSTCSYLRIIYMESVMCVWRGECGWGTDSFWICVIVSWLPLLKNKSQAYKLEHSGSSVGSMNRICFCFFYASYFITWNEAVRRNKNVHPGPSRDMWAPRTA